MFTGIVKEIGVVEGIDSSGDTRRLSIISGLLSEISDVGDSISVNGVCLTVVGKEEKILEFDVMRETLASTTIGSLKKQERVNLEPALDISGNKFLGGHIVTGHIDEISVITRVTPHGADTKQIELRIDPANTNLVVEKGSVAIEGVSLTISSAKADRFTVDLIPYTMKETILGAKRPGDKVNIEFDIIGKYVAKNIAGRSSSSITANFLAEHGFL